MFKIFKKQKKIKQTDAAETSMFADKIQSVQLIYSRPSDIFYNDLLELFVPDFLDKSNPIHVQFDKDFRAINADLSKLFSDVLENGLQTDAITAFYLRLEQLVKQDREVAFINGQTLRFWYHFIQNVQKEIGERLGNDALTKCETLSAKIKVLFEDYNIAQNRKK